MIEGEKIYDILIVGGGPAGLSAAIYAGRANLSVLVIERGMFGGDAFRAKELANYPGALPGETGAELSARLEAQAWSFGAEKAVGEVRSAEIEGEIKRITCGEKACSGKTLIIATGKASGVPAKLGIPGEEEYLGRGVSYCAICDGLFFADSDVFVIGGIDSALEESLYLAKITRHVTIIHDKDTFQGDEKLIKSIRETENITVLPDTVVTEIGGGDLLTRIETENVSTGEKSTISAGEGENFGFFIYIGTEPDTGIFGEALETENGYIVTDEEMRTNIPGVFAAGDVRRKAFRQAVMAAADGATAALFAGKYIMEAKKQK